MEIVVKERDAGYCNLKLFLLFLVVYGHLIEPWLPESRVLTEIYKMIYMVHMPLFVFLSGLFAGNPRQSGRQARKAILTYLAAMLLVGKNPLYPYWHLWYLCSLAFWSLIGVLWQKVQQNTGKRLCLAASFIVGCAVGELSLINRWLSLSRTIVFLPYYLMGMQSRHQHHGSKTAAVLALLVGAAIYIAIREAVPVEFLYHAEPYYAEGDTAVGYYAVACRLPGGSALSYGVLLRAACYIVGCCWGYFLWQLRCERRFPWTKMGADTLWIYILHAPVVQLLRGLQVKTPLAAVIVIVICYKVTQWSGRLFMVRERERRLPILPVKEREQQNGNIQRCI